MSGWLELANDTFNLIGPAVFQCMEHQCTTKVRRKPFDFSFRMALAKLTWLRQLISERRPLIIKLIERILTEID
jgi:hypothetical protein